MNTLTVLLALSLPPTLLLLLDALVKGAVLLMIARVATLLLRRGSAATRHLIWTTALAGVLLLPLLSRATPGWKVLPHWVDVSVATQLDEEPKVTILPDSDSIPEESGGSLPDSGAPDIQPLAATRTPAPAPSSESADSPKTEDDHPMLPKATVQSPASSNEALEEPRAGIGEHPRVESHERAEPASPISAIFFWLWVAGFTVFGARILLSWTGLRFLARKANHLAGRPRKLLSQLSSRLGIHREVRLLASKRRKMPVVWGIFRPTVLLPADWDTWGENRLRSVLLHELAHIRRGDAAAQFLGQIACALNWFNPLVWAAAFRARIEREQACDDLVLTSGVKASDYAEHLLGVATNYNQYAQPVNISTIAMANRFKLEGRLMYVLNNRLNRSAHSWKTVAISGAAFAAILLPLSMVQAAPPEEQASERESRTDAGSQPAGITTIAQSGLKKVIYQSNWTKPEQPLGKEWTSPSGWVQFSPNGKRVFLGSLREAGATFRMNDLPAHQVVHLEFDLIIRGSWDGNQPKGHYDRAIVELGDGRTLLASTFRTYPEHGIKQSYPFLHDSGKGNPVHAGAVEHGTLGYLFSHNGDQKYPVDAIYHMDWYVPHSDSTLEWKIYTRLGKDDLRQTIWVGLDRVKISVLEGEHTFPEKEWGRLAAALPGEDPFQANGASWQMLRAPAQTRKWLASGIRQPAAPVVQPQELKNMIEQLTAEDAPVRQRAAEKLLSLPADALPQLQAAHQALADGPRKSRLGKIVGELGKGLPEPPEKSWRDRLHHLLGKGKEQLPAEAPQN